VGNVAVSKDSATDRVQAGQSAGQEPKSSEPLQQPSPQLVPQSSQQLQVSSSHSQVESPQMVAVGVPPAQIPEELHVVSVVHGSLSSQALPVRTVTEHVESPSHTRVLHWSLVHVIGVPPVQTPLALHVSS
jgi:hypothetical protein